jgi:hypothetical protein
VLALVLAVALVVVVLLWAICSELRHGGDDWD